MRTSLLFILIVVSSQLIARTAPAREVDPWRAHFGLMAGMNFSLLQIGGAHHEVSTMQWTAAFGAYYKSAVRNMWRVEVQTGYEVAGAGREVYYRRRDDEYVRIFDRYRTIPLTLIFSRSIGWKETISLGVGLKSSFVANYGIRHTGTPETPGVVLTPQARRWFGSPVMQLSASFASADIALCGWYSVTRVIDQYNVWAAPYGITFMVKARLFNRGE